MWKLIVSVWNWLTNIDTDWPMVIVTIIYVIATLCIMKANQNAAKAASAQLDASKEQLAAAKEQLDISKEQYEDSKRLEYMPILQMRLSHDEDDPHEAEYIDICPREAEVSSTTSQFFELKNVGNGTAINITFTWKFVDLGFSDTEFLPACAIMQGDSYKINLSCDMDKNLPKSSTLSLEFEYCDLLGNPYEQRIFLRIEDEVFVRCENDLPKHLGDKPYVFENREVHHE